MLTAEVNLRSGCGGLKLSAYCTKRGLEDNSWRDQEPKMVYVGGIRTSACAVRVSTSSFFFSVCST